MTEEREHAAASGRGPREPLPLRPLLEKDAQLSTGGGPHLEADVPAAERQRNPPGLGDGQAKLPGPAARRVSHEDGGRIRPGVGLSPWAGGLREGTVDEYAPELFEPPAVAGGVGSEIDERRVAKPPPIRAVQVGSVHVWSIERLP